MFFPLCWIPRHSPKVVKAASQVLNSMWQYRDLRSLYKKVKSKCALAVLTLSNDDCKACRCIISYTVSSPLFILSFLFLLFFPSGWLFPVPFCWLLFHDRERQTATLFFLPYSVHLSRTDLTQQSIRWVTALTLLSSLLSSINLSNSIVQSNVH